MNDALPSFACPACGNPLHVWRCNPCNASYPMLEAVPVLLPEPEMALADWRNRWRLERQRLYAEERRASAAAATAAGIAAARLNHLAAALAKQRACLESLLAPMLGNDRGGARETLLGLRTRLPGHHAVTGYATNVLRDWAWGQPETLAAARAIRGHLPEGATTPITVLGAGACGLAAELGRERPVVALDSNPLLLLVAARLLAGTTAEFVEFPTAPRHLDDVAVVHLLQPPPATNVQPVLGDIRFPPFPAASLPVVVTHWLIDVIDLPLGVLAATLNHVLEPGGVWINQGSLAFTNGNPAWNPCLEEIPEILRASGFEMLTCSEEDQPYQQSPHHRQRRYERVVTWSARKVGAVPPPDNRSPDWLADGAQPIPLLPAFQAQATAVGVHAWIMSQVNGQRGVDAIAAELSRQGLMPPEEARAAVRGFVRTMFEEMLRSGD